jgi:hypothetical protein
MRLKERARLINHLNDQTPVFVPQKDWQGERVSSTSSDEKYFRRMKNFGTKWFYKSFNKKKGRKHVFENLESDFPQRWSSQG